MRNRSAVIRALKWAFVMSSGQRALSTLFTFILAGIIGPHDFGLVAMALVYIAFLQLFIEQGLPTAVIQRENLEPEHLDSAFWLNLVACLALGGVGVALSGWWAGVNDQPELASVIRVLSVLVLIIGLYAIQQAVMQRRLEFRKLALRSNVAALVGGVAGVALAIEGAGIWALVTQQIATDAAALVLIWVISPWRPRWRFSRRHAKDLLGFGIDVFAANLGAFVGRRADVLLMGIFFGPAVVGLYRLADRLVDTVVELTIRPIVLVSLPVFSRLQNDRDGLREAVRSCLRATIVVVVPSMLVVLACSPYLVAAIGPEWEPASQALQLLAVAGIVKGIVYFAGPLLFAKGRPRLRAGVLWTFALFGVVTVTAVGVILSSASPHDQLLGMSATRALGFVLVVLPVNLLIILKLADLPLREVLQTLPLPLAAGLGAIGGVEAIGAIGVTDTMAALPALIVAVAAAVGAALAVVVIAMLAGGAERRARLLTVLRAIRRRPGSDEHLGDAAFGWLLGPERPNVE